MGCSPSKQSVCRNCNAQCSPVRRSYSSHPNRSPVRKSYSSHPSRSTTREDDDDNHRVVALTSTTLGYILLDNSIKSNEVARVLPQPFRRNAVEENNNGFAVGVVEAETWSKLIDEKITEVVPKTPIAMPPGEPEMINAWELMEGLNDSSPLQPPPPRDHTHCFLFNTNPHSNEVKPLINGDKETATSQTKEKLILYFTSLRGVRKTYEDCCHIRAILKNSGVRVDERDVSMHSGFKEELKELLGDRHGGGGLPKVFVGRKYIGGADEIRRFHNEFQLDKMLEGCEMVVGGSGGDSGDGEGCEACGDIRFLPCEICSGSCKIYYEVNPDKVKGENTKSDYGFQRCPDCNENGLIRCPICCD